MTTNNRAQARDDAAAALRQWWQALDESRGDRAALRRCATLTEVVFVPAYHRLFAAVAKHGWTDRVGVAAIAGLASLVREDVTGATLARQMAQTKQGGSKARISGLRFRRLLKQQSREDLFPALGRVVRALGGQANLADLAESAYWWNDRTRQAWAFEYYAAAPGEQ